MTFHVASIAMFVPIGLLPAGFEAVSRKSTVVTVFVETCFGHVSFHTTEVTHQQLLRTYTKTHCWCIYIYAVWTSQMNNCAIRRTNFALGTVLGEMTGLVAVSAADTLLGEVSV